MKRLKTIFVSSLESRLHLGVIGLTLAFLSLKYFYFVFLIPPFLYLFRNRKWILLFTIVITLFSIANYELRIHIPSRLNEKQSVFIAWIDKSLDGKYYAFVNCEKVLVMDNQDYPPGSMVEIKGYLKRPTKKIDSDSFDYQMFLKRKGITYQLYVTSSSLKRKGFNLNSISYFLEKAMKKNHSEKTIGYLDALILGNKNMLDDEIKSEMSDLGVSHLLSISGLHLFLLTLGICKILAILKIKKKNLVLILFLVFMNILTGFPPSVLRVSLVYALKILFERKGHPLESIDYLSLSMIILVLMNPCFMFNTGFILSYLVAFGLILSFDYLQGPFLKKAFLTSLIAFLMTLPIVINMSGQVNLFSIIANILLVPYFSYLILPLCYLDFLIPFFDSILCLVINYYENLVSLLSNVTFLTISFPYFYGFILFPYYGLLFFTFQNPSLKWMLSLTLFLILFSNYRLISPLGTLSIFEVGQGDTALISLPFNQGNMVIDCFGDGEKKINHSGIKKIDILVITHGHEDHIRGAFSLVESGKVKKIIFSEFDNSDLTKELKKLAIKKKIPFLCLKGGDYFYLGGVRVDVLLPVVQDTSNLNNDSLVILVNLKKKELLFMGDMEDNDRFISKMEVDLVKIGHHGSMTATTDAFLKKVSFRKAIISVGQGNKYHLPDEETIKRLKNKKIFETKSQGSYNEVFFA